MSDEENDCDLQGTTQSENSKALTADPILKDPLHVPNKRRPKSLRQKNPKENHLKKQKKCSVCKTPGHTKTRCPVSNQERYVLCISLRMIIFEF